MSNGTTNQSLFDLSDAELLDLKMRSFGDPTDDEIDEDLGGD